MPKLDQQNNPGMARWCEGHTRLECVRNRTKGRGQCHAPAVRGTDRCTKHGGVRREILRTKGEATISAWNATRGTPTIDYRMVVLATLQMTWLRLGAYSELLRRQVATDGEVADDPGTQDQPQASGLIGYRYGAAGKDGVVYVQNEETRALVNLEAAERDRVIRYAKVAHDMGISERLTNLAERWGDIVATRITLMFEALELTEAQAAMLPALVSTHLGSIDVEAVAGDDLAKQSKELMAG